MNVDEVNWWDGFTSKSKKVIHSTLCMMLYKSRINVTWYVSHIIRHKTFSNESLYFKYNHTICHGVSDPRLAQSSHMVNTKTDLLHSSRHANLERKVLVVFVAKSKAWTFVFAPCEQFTTGIYNTLGMNPCVNTGNVDLSVKLIVTEESRRDEFRFLGVLQIGSFA